jgi:hypothetical protein
MLARPQRVPATQISNRENAPRERYSGSELVVEKTTVRYRTKLEPTRFSLVVRLELRSYKRGNGIMPQLSCQLPAYEMACSHGCADRARSWLADQALDARLGAKARIGLARDSAI